MVPDASGAAPAAVPSYVPTATVGFLSSLSVDRPLARFDIAGSLAHVEALGAAGLLAPGEVRDLQAGLRSVAREIASGTFRWREELEDVHTNVEVRLTELVGPVGGKLHTGRSRNDQVALDERLYLRAAILSLGEAAAGLCAALLDRAAAEATSPMPGYTHLQRAQPVTLGHHLLAHFWRFDRDVDRLLATAARADVSPLGAGALAGSTLAIDPSPAARRLGFSATFENSLDAVSDRDPLAELLFDLALLAVHASALGEEVVLFASKEFGFVERSEALGSGSSLMPQKRNPDVAELARGRAGRPIGDLVALLTVLKGLPLAYDRDLQEDKAPVLDSVATVLGTVRSLDRLVREIRFDRERLRAAAADPELYATDRAEQLVAAGTPFRQAHEAVRASVLRPSPGAADAGAPDPAASLARRSAPGSPGPSPVALQIQRAHARLAERRDSLSSLARKVERIEELVTEETT